MFVLNSTVIPIAAWLTLCGIPFCGAVIAQDATADKAAQLRPQMLGTIKESDISESSGLATSGTTSDAFWTMNDSGHKPDLFLVANSGQPLARCKLKNANNRDWEAMGSFEHDGSPWLMVADVGDNSLNRGNVKIYLLPEPQLSADKSNGGKSKKKKKKKKKSGEKLESDVSLIEFTYSDGAHNVEAAAVSPDGKSVWFIEKIYSNDTRPIQPGIYKLSLNESDFDLDSDEEPPVRSATRLADYPIRNVTGMAFSPDGRRLIVRNYLNAHLFTKRKDQTWEETVSSNRPDPVILPIQSQGEAICFTSDSKSVLITSEFKRSTIWKVKLPSITP